MKTKCKIVNINSVDPCMYCDLNSVCTEDGHLLSSNCDCIMGKQCYQFKNDKKRKKTNIYIEKKIKNLNLKVENKDRKLADELYDEMLNEINYLTNVVKYLENKLA